MVYDFIYFFIRKKIRIELCLHHLLCAYLFYYYNLLILTFCSTCEIISAFNWISIIYPKYVWMTKYIRLTTILSVRFFIWFATSLILTNISNNYYVNSYHIQIPLLYIYLILSFFIMLDCYWLFIILQNFIKFNKNK